METDRWRTGPMRRWMRKTALRTGMAVGLVGTMAISASWATSAQGAASVAARRASRGTVGVSVPQTVDPYFIAVTDYFKREAESQGYKVLTADANGEIATQINQIETFVSEGVKAIAIDSINDQTIVPAIKDANKAGIPVFFIDTFPSAKMMKALGAHIVATVESNNAECGRTSTEEMLRWLHGRNAVVGRVILPLAQSTVTRQHAFDAAIKGHKNVHVVATVNGEASYDTALTAVSQMLSGHPTIKVVWGDNGPVGVGAARAVIGAHLVGKVHVFANATVVPADQLIEKGNVMVAGATQFPAIEGATIAYDMGKYLSGNHKVPYRRYTPCLPVTHGNAKAVTAYNEREFSYHAPIQILHNHKIYQIEAHGALKKITLP